MFLRNVAISALSAVFLSGVLAQGVNAGHPAHNRAEGIVLALVVSALAKAAASSANAHKDNDIYRYHHGLGARENAVAACVHQAHKVVRKAGGYYLRLEKVAGVSHTGDGNYKVAVRVAGIYRWGRKKSTVNCVVNHNLVKNFFSS